MKVTITANINNKTERLLLLSDAAKTLHVTRQAVLKMINEGKIRAIRKPDGFLVLRREIVKQRKDILLLDK